MASLSSIARRIAKSASSPLHKGAKCAVPGEGPAHAHVMLVGEAPGKQEDQTGRPFVGRSGVFLDRVLKDVGVNRKKLFITSVLKFYPPNGKVRMKDVEVSLPWLIDQIKVIHPRVVLLMGKTAQSVRDQLPEESQYFETVHPAAAMRFPKYRRTFVNAIRRIAKFV